MPNLNVVHLIGNLTRDPEVRYTQGKGTAFTEIGLAINKYWQDDQRNKQESTTFVDVTLWGRTAEVVGEYARKGHPIYIQGELVLDQWEDKQTGEKRQRLRVTGHSIQFLKPAERREPQELGGQQRQQPQQQRGTQQRTQQGQGYRQTQQRQASPQHNRPHYDPDLDPPQVDDIPF